jgi:hypothetical protein
MIGFCQNNYHLMRNKMRFSHGDFVFKMKMPVIILLKMRKIKW